MASAPCTREQLVPAVTCQGVTLGTRHGKCWGQLPSIPLVCLNCHRDDTIPAFGPTSGSPQEVGDILCELPSSLGPFIVTSTNGAEVTARNCSGQQRRVWFRAAYVTTSPWLPPSSTHSSNRGSTSPPSAPFYRSSGVNASAAVMNRRTSRAACFAFPSKRKGMFVSAHARASSKGLVSSS